MLSLIPGRIVVMAMMATNVANEFTYPTNLMNTDALREPISIPIKYTADMIPMNNEDSPANLSLKDSTVFINPYPDIRNPVLNNSKPIDMKFFLDVL